MLSGVPLRVGLGRRAYPCRFPPPDSGVTTSDLRPQSLRAALTLTPFDGRAAQGPLEPLFRGVPPAAVRTDRPRDGAALLYAFAGDGDLYFPLTLRRDHLAEHRGQVALPGGRPEPGESLWDAALREAREEVGLEVAHLERLGVLAPVYIPVTHTNLHVHVALGPPPGPLTPQPEEVAQLVLASLTDLLRPERRRVFARTIRGAVLEVPGLLLGGLEVWGATAMALSELAERLRRVMRAPA